MSISVGQPTISDTAISTAMESLDVESTVTTPGSHTPVPVGTLSEDTLSILEEASAKLKKSKKGAPRREREPSPSTSSNPNKRKRTDSAERPQSKFPEGAKPLYLKAKNLYIRKLHLATSVHHIKAQLEDGKFPVQVGFKCQPPSTDSSQFSINWNKTVSGHKRQLTLMWIEELSRKYTVCKSDIRKILENLQAVLSKDHFTEMKRLLDERYKEAASKKLSKKMQDPAQPRGKGRRPPPKGARNRKGPGPNQQMQRLLTGLSKLIKNNK